MENKIPGKDVLRSLLEKNRSGSLRPEEIAWVSSCIDHTLLKEDATQAQLFKLCQEARQYHFATVCVHVKHLGYCVENLQGSAAKPIAVVGFPTGNVSTAAKTQETREAVRLGAREIDMVIQVEQLKRRQLQAVLQDVQSVVQAAPGIPVKVILETCLLTDEEKIIGSALAKAAGAAFVKTSTGFSSGGAKETDVALLRLTVGADMGVKASGGVRSLEDALKMLLAGANRLGSSSGVAILSLEQTSATASY